LLSKKCKKKRQSAKKGDGPREKFFENGIPISGTKGGRQRVTIMPPFDLIIETGWGRDQCLG